MKRLVDYDLWQWKNSERRKPLLLRGARQVGKTYAVRQLGKKCDDFVEVNFELRPDAIPVFETNLKPERIIRDLSILLNKKIIPGKTLLFFDEIQAAPKAIISLRYFYELMPELHVIAAGSLLDFSIESIGIPVGRVVSLYMYPMSFIEFLHALDYGLLLQSIFVHDVHDPMPSTLHEPLVALFGQFMAVGGMPEAVSVWRETQDLQACGNVHRTLVDSYRQDFAKYATRFQIKYIERLFSGIPRQMGNKFKYSAIEGEYRKRDLVPCFDLLQTAGVAHRVYRTRANGVPLGSEAEYEYFKAILLDVALSQTMLDVSLGPWLLKPLETLINKGPLVETAVGQELLAYSSPWQKSRLYYWISHGRSAEAEVDYVVVAEGNIVPIEVKSGSSARLKSMRMFLNCHKESPYGIRFWGSNYDQNSTIHSFPLYAIAGAFDRFSDVQLKIL